MAMQTGLEGKPWYVGLIVGLIVGGVVYVGGYRLKLGPMKQTIRSQESRLAELQGKIQEGRAAKAKLPQFREEVRRLELDLEKLLRILPARLDTEGLLRRLRALTEQGDLDLKRINPAVPVEREFFREWPINLSLDGDYHNLALFFDRISRFPRIINIDNLRVDSINEGRGNRTIAANFQAKTFVYKEMESEAPTGSQQE